MSLTQKVARRLSSSASSLPDGKPSSSTPNGHTHPPPSNLDCTFPANGVKVVLIVDGAEVRVRQRGGNGRVLFVFPTLHVLSARLLPSDTSQTLQITYLSPSAPHNLLNLQLLPTPSPTSPLDPPAFLELLKKAAYPKSKPNRRVYLVVNPVGGQGKARKMTSKTVLPILRSAGCEVTVVETSAVGQATELAEKLDVDDYDVVGCVSGDGTLHEIFNGFARRPDARNCLRLPVVPVPCGSGNSLSVSLHGKVSGFSIALAALNLAKGTPLAMDLCSVTQGDESRKISFLSTALGVIADLDLGTEHLRWMGDHRFMYGFLRGALTQPDWPGSISMLVVESDRAVLSQQMHDRLDRNPSVVEEEKEQRATAADGEDGSEGLPPLKFTNGPEEGWVTLDGLAEGNEVLYIYAGLTPAAGRDLIQWPFSNPGDGLLDVVVQKKVGRTTLLSQVAVADYGGQVYEPSSEYFQVRALYIDPAPPRPSRPRPTKHPLISVDGEAIQASKGPLMVEVHAGLGTTLSLSGRWGGTDDFYKKGLKTDPAR